MFYRGTVTARTDVGDSIKKGEQGIITAYIPEMKIFAVHFDSNRWFTFSDEKEKEFLKKFYVMKKF